MLPANLLNALKAYVLEQKTPLPAASEVKPKTEQFEVGKKFEGSVQTQVSPGVFNVRIAQQLVQMQLPSTIRSGDKVALQVIATEPRLTFSMVGSANPLSTPEQLGSMARLLSSMSQQAPEKAYVRLAQSAPIWDKPQPTESKQLAGLLHEALSNSGLFYESHQAQWLEGVRSTAQLLHEPQNLPPEQVKAAMAGDVSGKAAPGDAFAKAAMAGDTSGKTAMAGDASGKTPTASETTEKTAMMNNTADSAVTARNSTNTSNQPNTTSLPEDKIQSIPDHLQPLVQQQLNALETRQMVWQGNIWPDQPMQWEVHEQAPQTPGVEEQRQWVTQLQLNLPNLGEVAATLRFNSAGLSLTLNASTPETRAVLGNASARLVTAMTDAGVPVLSAQVATA